MPDWIDALSTGDKNMDISAEYKAHAATIGTPFTADAPAIIGLATRRPA